MPGAPQSVNSLPVTMAVSPDGRYIAILNQGYGTKESGFRQSISILDTQTNVLTDFPDDRFKLGAKQTYFLGLVFNGKGDELYASVGSLSDPEGKNPGDTGNGIAVYSFADGKISPKRFISIPLQTLPAMKQYPEGYKVPYGKSIPFPAGLAIVPPDKTHPERLLVADNLADNVLVMDPHTGEIERTFDMSDAQLPGWIPSTYPYAVLFNTGPEGHHHAWASMWNTPKVAELNLDTGQIRRIIIDRNESQTMSSHPTAMVFSPKGDILFVALTNRDKVVALNVLIDRIVQTFSIELPGQKKEGSYPDALALSPDGTRLYVAAAGLNAVAVYHIRITDGHVLIDSPKVSTGPVRGIAPVGFIPTEWYPTAVALQGNNLYIASGKGQSTGPNNIGASANGRKPFTYIPELLHGSIAHLDVTQLDRDLPQMTAETMRSNLMGTSPVKITFAASAPRGMRVASEPPPNVPPPVPGVKSKPVPIPKAAIGWWPIRHVIYVIKENRTYDQIFGDLGVGDGDPKLAMYGKDITPNQHKLALQFGVLDNFYDSGEVSGDGHVWSTAAITSDYTEKTWQINYRGGQRTYDYEGEVAHKIPSRQNITDVDEPGTGYLWENAAKLYTTYRDYGEYVASTWCVGDDWNGNPATQGETAADCQNRKVIHKGDPLPYFIGGQPSPYPWDIPILARNIPTKPQLVDHTDPLFPGFRLNYPDQLRIDEFLREFDLFITAKISGNKKQEMPQLVVLRLPNDHTAGTTPGMPTPSASVADNDLAVGRLVDAVSHSPYWNDTAILILEDDAQDGPDHVDAHRSTALVISKYSPRLQRPFIDHRFYTTVNMIRTLEDLLGLPPMNINDSEAAPIAPLFTGKGDQPPFVADRINQQNGLIYQMNKPNAPGAKASAAMDFSKADDVNSAKLNQILWRDRMGKIPMPPPRHTVIPERGGDGGDTGDN